MFKIFKFAYQIHLFILRLSSLKSNVKKISIAAVVKTTYLKCFVVS